MIAERIIVGQFILAGWLILSAMGVNSFADEDMPSKTPAVSPSGARHLIDTYLQLLCHQTLTGHNTRAARGRLMSPAGLKHYDAEVPRFRPNDYDFADFRILWEWKDHIAVLGLGKSNAWSRVVVLTIVCEGAAYRLWPTGSIHKGTVGPHGQYWGEYYDTWLSIGEAQYRSFAGTRAPEPRMSGSIHGPGESVPGRRLSVSCGVCTEIPGGIDPTRRK